MSVNLFSLAVHNNELVGTEYITLTADTKSGPLEFKLKDCKEYVHLSETVLQLKVKLTNQDGTTIEPKQADKTTENHVALVNNALHSIFSDVKVSLNDKLVEGGETMYAIKSYIGTFLRYHEQAMTNQLFLQGYVRDEYSKMDAVDNKAFVARKAWTDGGVVKEFYGKLDVDFFKQDRLLLPNIELGVTLEKSKDAFALMCSPTSLKPKVVIENAYLHLKLVKVHPLVMQDHMITLSKEIPAVYPFNRVEIQYLPMKEKDTEFRKEGLFHGYVPKYITMVICSNLAFHGDYTKNPFNFKHYNLKSVCLKKDRNPIPYEEFRPDFKAKKCLKEYISILQSNNLLGKDAALPFSYEEFVNGGYTNFQWNLLNEYKNPNTQTHERATLQLDLAFADPLPESANVVLFGIFDANVMIYGNGTVLKDYD